MKKILSMFIALVLMLSVCALSVSADTATLAGSTGVYLGNTFTITARFKSSSSGGTGAVDATLTYDDSVLQCVSAPDNTSGGNGSYQISWVASKGGIATAEVSFKFKAIKAGTAGISLSSEITAFELDTPTTKKSATMRVTVTDRSTLSGNANLSRLNISSGTLVPKFSPNVTEYYVNLDNGVTELLLDTATEVNAAKITVEGAKEMAVGSNTRKITVTAPNGATKTYTIHITRAAEGEILPPIEGTTENNPFEIAVGGEKRYIVKSNDGITPPEGFASGKARINGYDLPAFLDTINNVTIVYAMDSSGESGNFYQYDTAQNSFSLYRYFFTDALRFVLLDYTDKKAIPAGYYFTNIEIGGYKVAGFMYSDPQLIDFYIFYGSSADGTEGFYRYDKTDGSVQRALDFTLALAEENAPPDNRNIFVKIWALPIKSKVVVFSAAAAIIILIVIAVCLIVRQVKSGKSEDEQDDRQRLEVEAQLSELYMGDIPDDAEERNPLIFDFTNNPLPYSTTDNYDDGEDEDDDF